MNDILIFGNNYFSELISEYIKEFANRKVAAFLVNKAYIKDMYINGIEVLPYEELSVTFNKENYDVLVTSGYKEMSELRKRICTDVKSMGFELYTFIHPNALVYTDEIGEGNIILEGSILSKHTSIGNGNIIWNGANISHHTKVGDYNYFSPSCTVGGRCIIENNCFLGLNATVKGGINVRSYTLVGAGAYLGKDSEGKDVYVPGAREKLENKTSLEMF